jgi:hypothetical protein
MNFLCEESGMAAVKNWLLSPKGKMTLGGTGLVVAIFVVLRFTLWAPAPVVLLPENVELTPVFRSTPQDIVGFEVQGRGDHVSLTKTAQGWMFLTPENARANPHAVYLFLTTLCEWTPIRHLEHVAATEMRDPFGFEENATKYKVTRGDGTKIEFITGKYDFSAGLYAKTGTDELYVMEKKQALDSKGLLYFLRDHNVFPESLTGIKRMSFRNQGKAVTLSCEVSQQQRRRFGANTTTLSEGEAATLAGQGLPWKIVYPRKFPANQQVVIEILDMVKQWEVKAYVLETVGTRRAMSRFGFVHPLGELILHTQNSRIPIHLTFSSPPSNPEKIYLKTSIQSQIVEVGSDQFIILEELFSHVTSQHLAHFLSQVARIEMLTEKWQVTIARNEDLWEGSLQSRLNSKRAPRDVFAQEKKEMRFFEGEILVDIIKKAEYIDCLTVQNPLFPKYQAAKKAMKITFNRDNGKVLEIFTVLQHKGMKEMVFLRRQQDNEIYLVVHSFYDSLLKELEYQLTHKKTSDTIVPQ